jgi:hypothetical protein
MVIHPPFLCAQLASFIASIFSITFPHHLIRAFSQVFYRPNGSFFIPKPWALSSANMKRTGCLKGKVVVRADAGAAITDLPWGETSNGIIPADTAGDYIENDSIRSWCNMMRN